MLVATWQILNVAPQREFLVQKDMQALGLLAMVPSEKRWRKSRGKDNRPVMVAYAHPIISSYVFVGSDRPMPWRAIKETDFTRGWVSFSRDGTPAKLSDRDIDMIRRMVGRSNGGAGLQVGDAARLTDGPYQNLEAIVRAIGRDKVTISVQFFGSERELSVTVDKLEKSA